MAVASAYAGNTYRAQFEFEDATSGRIVKQTVVVAATTIADVSSVIEVGLADIVPALPSGITFADIDIFAVTRVEATDNTVIIGDAPTSP